MGMYKIMQDFYLWPSTFLKLPLYLSGLQSTDLANNPQNCYKEDFHHGKLIKDFKMQTGKRLRHQYFYDIGALLLKLTNPNPNDLCC